MQSLKKNGPMLGQIIALFCCLNLSAPIAVAQSGQEPSGAERVEDRFWILWQRIKLSGAKCSEGGLCDVRHSFSSRPLDTNNTGFIMRLFGRASPLKAEAPLPQDHKDAPKVCPPQPHMDALGFDPLAQPKSEKGEVLRGVNALHVDLTGLKAPPGFGADFGTGLHQKFVRELEQAGIRVVTKEGLSGVPGQPVLNLYFSFSDPDDLCDYAYSVFASLSQDVLLTRDVRIKVAAGVWSYSIGSTAKDHQGTEADAIMRVAAAFVRDHRQVNAQ